MSTQGHLFAPAIAVAIEKSLQHPIAAKLDPDSSRNAASVVTKSGRRQAQLLAVLALVKKYPRSTARELAKKSLGIDRYAVSRRLPELEAGELVRRCAARCCTIGGISSLTWEAL